VTWENKRYSIGLSWTKRVAAQKMAGAPVPNVAAFGGDISDDDIDDDLAGIPFPQIPPQNPPVLTLTACELFAVRRPAGTVNPPDAQEQSLLLALPDEILSLVAGYLGPRCSVKTTTWNPTSVFSACQRLHAIGRQISTRVEFLLGNFGGALVVHGLGSWLGLVDPEVHLKLSFDVSIRARFRGWLATRFKLLIFCN